MATRRAARPAVTTLEVVTRSLESAKRFVFILQDIFVFGGRTIASIVRPPFYGTDLVEQMYFAGNGSVAIAILSNFFAGQALALQVSKELVQWGSKEYLGRLVATAVVRSLGPVLTGMVVASRLSAGWAAEVGSMRISNQIEALEAYGIDPVRKLAVPRLVALVLMLPVLTTMADLISILGGFLISRVVVHISPQTYWSGVWASMEYGDLLVGAVKPFFFAAIIAIVGVYKGFHAEGGTKGVGIATTEAVVITSVSILVADLILTRVVFNLLNW